MSRPAHWDRLYPREARRAPVVSDMTRFEDAVALVGVFLAPVLDGTAPGRRWVASACRWEWIA